MKRIMLLLLTMMLGVAMLPSHSFAESEDACAIWICLPGGFPSGCEGAYREFKDRIKHRKPPLPALSSCTTGPNGEHVDGRYELGLERFEACEDDYVLREGTGNGGATILGMCYLKRCAPAENQNGNDYCQHYEAVKRLKPNYIKMWVDGDYLGQFWYQ